MTLRVRLAGFPTPRWHFLRPAAHRPFCAAYSRLPTGWRSDGFVRSRRGAVLRAGVLDSVVTLLSQPVVALLVGIILGVGLLLASRSSFRLMTPENPGAGFALITMLLFARMALAAGLLWSYNKFASDGFIPFAIGFAGGFFVGYWVELARYVGVGRTRTR